jgi:TRAP-type C4-dicarboxylate transport system substrate-binding protein
MVVISEKAWQALAPADQQILSEVAEDAQAVVWARFATIRAEAFAAAVQKGVRIVGPSGRHRTVAGLQRSSSGGVYGAGGTGRT